MLQKRVTKLLHSQKPVPTDSPLVAPFPGTIGTYHSIPLIWILSLQSLSKVSLRTDSGHLLRPGQDHSSSQEPHPKLRKRRPWAQNDPPFQTQNHHPYRVGSSQRDTALFFPFFMISGSGMKESLGLEKKTTVSKALAESSNFRENKTEL